ncbi:MAG: CDP-glycerol glycerophosphotransferase family protein [Candidatus Pacebacteria bacterium]|nr:CDP-glycerol glycerophosphotransferase family protein [Candidatus Paceibacterota bacterium]
MEIFADNAKYLYLYIANAKGDIRPIWLAKDRGFAKLLRKKGFEAYYEKSFSGIWHALTSGTTVIDAFLQPENYRFSGGSRLVQLLHGKGMKKGGYNEKPRQAQDIIFSTSPFVSSMLPPRFVEDSPIKVAGYPRADIFFKEIKGADISIDMHAKKVLSDSSYKKRILYAPTFRRGLEKLDLEEVLDLSALSAWAIESQNLLLMSLHPKYRSQARGLSYPNVYFIEESDIYPLLPLIDLMITDYSSLFTDYLLLDRPIVFYAYDLETYKEREGLSFENYDEYTPGPKASSPSELLSVLKSTLEKDNHAMHRARVRDLYHTHQDGNSSARVLEALTR